MASMVPWKNPIAHGIFFNVHKLLYSGKRIIFWELFTERFFGEPKNASSITSLTLSEPFVETQYCEIYSNLVFHSEQSL